MSPRGTQTLAVERRGGVVVLRGQSCGAADSCALAHALVDAVAELEETVDRVSAVVLESTAPAFFLRAPATAREHDLVATAWGEATAAVASLTAPTVAVIREDAVGPGWELAMACDLRIASRAALIGNPDVRLGRIPAAGGTQRLVRVAGLATALCMLLLGEIVSAEDGLERGLVHLVAAPEALDSELERLVDNLDAASAVALAYAKEAMHAGLEVTVQQGLRLEADLVALLLTTEDQSEGLAAFAERREPRFSGR